VKSWFQAFAFTCNLFRYTAAAHYHFYGELERRLDDAAAGPHPTPSGALWWGAAQAESSCDP
jgi:hypothetical protein